MSDKISRNSPPPQVQDDSWRLGPATHLGAGYLWVWDPKQSSGGPFVEAGAGVEFAKPGTRFSASLLGREQQLTAPLFDQPSPVQVHTLGLRLNQGLSLGSQMEIRLHQLLGFAAYGPILGDPYDYRGELRIEDSHAFHGELGMEYCLWEGGLCGGLLATRDAEALDRITLSASPLIRNETFSTWGAGLMIYSDLSKFFIPR